MPSNVPRSDTSKKREQVLQRQRQLEHAIRSKRPDNKLLQAAERVREAQLSLLKARLHWALEARFRYIYPPSTRTRDFGEIAKIEEATRAWTDKSAGTIISEYSTYKITMEL